MNLFLDVEKLRKDVDEKRRSLQGIRSEYALIEAESRIYREHGKLYDKFKSEVLEPELKRLAISRMGVPVDDRDSHVRHEGAYDEIRRLLDRREKIELKEVELLGQIKRFNDEIESAEAKIRAEVLKEAKKSA